ncbi:MAG: hypothetical protein M8860_02005 [marine benthic group bacterium]|jgi:hypothetical protein|nr:hypothetical protein [Gemmatimonadota bacterium]MCL7961609.1 hypothetical protein [Candidatus Carthagonibacter metallireducens]MCL7966010.1 hypothetical protein [Gemmatimonadota bacterium]MCL7970143.1 hypothetical protein [Gemmatimonadota bacterium]MCL7973744.1 hypothetical protein [Gemmatimonadota bacterium]
MPRTPRSHLTRSLLPLLLLGALSITACTKPVTTNVAPPAVASLTEDQEVVGLLLKDGTEQLFNPISPVLENGTWIGQSHGQEIRIPASEVQQVIVQEEKTDVLSIVAIGAFAALGIAAIAIAADQR